MNTSILQKRIKKITDKIAKDSLDAILLSSLANIIYCTDFFAFSHEEREAYILITAKNQYIITSSLYAEAVKKHTPHLTLLETSAEKSTAYYLNSIVKKEKIKSVGFEADNLTVAEYKHFLSSFKKMKNCTIDDLRVIKDTEEITKLKEACDLGDKTFTHILTKITIGVSEKELANEIEFHIRKNGGVISFRPIVAFGSHASSPHHVSSDRKLKKNEFVLFDFGAKIKGYCSDMTRTVFFGTPNTEQKKMYQTVLVAQQKAIDYIMKEKNPSGFTADRTARDYIISQGYPSIPHSLGHGIGLEVHEFPRLSPGAKDITLQTNMVFSVEPGIYLPGIGGVRIEDLMVIEKNKRYLLTQSPRDLVEL